MKLLDKSGLPGKYKAAWIYQHGILPRLLWPLLVYDVLITKFNGKHLFEESYASYSHSTLQLSIQCCSTLVSGRTYILPVLSVLTIISF